LALARNLGMVMGVASAEMVIAFRLPAVHFENVTAGPSLESIQDVWKLMLIIGLIAILISWTREREPDVG